ncbi:MAG: hypothetical protein ACD_75C02174G0002 [uncultured bacterium]|nr:MAG: hypothetical protein ACD_75C02174G0002 [uncultured bacterium]
MGNPFEKSNEILDAILNWQYPPFSEETGIDRVVAFGDHSHRCPIYVRQTPPCTGACPAGNDIRAWLTTVQQTELKKRSRQESYQIAWHEASKTTPFPASCGRICPFPCETACNRVKKEAQGVNIAAFERWIGDYGIAQGLDHKKLRTVPMARKVAVVGAGPAGLSCAFQLARRGYPVTVFEALTEPGGMLRYGIPAFRLPRAVLDAEIDAIARMGVDILCSHAIDSNGLQEIRKRFDAVFVGVGAHKGIELDLKGQNAANVFSGVTFLRRVNAGEVFDIGDRVIVAGGGNTAITAARAARRLGAQVTIIYRRTRAEMPTLDREIEHSLLENITIRYLVAPLGIRIENGRAVAVQCVKNGIIVWETQATNYPKCGEGFPNHEPRGCPRGATFSWYTYSPIRLKYPLVRSSLLELWRQSLDTHGEPVEAWRNIINDPDKRRKFQRDRGKGGLVRLSWDEASTITASSLVHTIQRYGPDRIFVQ